jgi:transposase
MERDFANFGLKGLEPKPKGRPKTMNNKRKKGTDKPLTEKKNFREIETLIVRTNC